MPAGRRDAVADLARGGLPVAGEHGRQNYDELEPDVVGRPTPELDPEHPSTIVTAADSDGLSEGERMNGVLKFLCTCGNADEDLFEIVHDEACPLASDGDGMTCQDSVGVVLADGGED